MTATEIYELCLPMKDGDKITVHNVIISKKHGLWWVQAGGGVQFSRTALRAAEKARALLKET